MIVETRPYLRFFSKDNLSLVLYDYELTTFVRDDWSPTRRHHNVRLTIYIYNVNTLYIYIYIEEESS